jgi:small-conductance mechanosensitive channel
VKPLEDPRVVETLLSLGLLGAAYLAARAVSFLLGRTLARAAERTHSRLDDELLSGLKRPVTYLLFLVGASFAVQRLPLPDPWARRLDQALMVLGILLVTLSLLRTWRVALQWYATRPRFLEDGGLVREFGPLLGKLGSLFIAAVAAIAILQRLGLDVSSLVVSLGVGSLALGLAAQDTLANMFAGFILMLDRPFRIGERIRLASGEVGDVEAIGIRATRIKTLDETVLFVPNSVLVKEKLVNQSRPTREITSRLELGVAYGTDLARARRVLADAALAAEYVATERAPVVLVTRFADSSINLLLIFWARDYTEQGLALSAVHEEVDRRFREHGIEIAFPVRRLIQEAVGPPEKRSEA